MLPPLSFGAILFALLLAASPPTATAVNHTIDDTFGDSSTGFRPQYAPGFQWSIGGPICTNCLPTSFDLDPKQLFNGTYHLALSQNVTLTLNFTGTAIYVYNVLVNSIANSPNFSTTTNLTFALDGVRSTASTSFVHAQTNLNSNITYNALVYSTASLPYANHSLVMTNIGPLCFFDYAIYTTQNASALPNASTLPRVSPHLR
ncbi:uncharacterized protein BXZ73DRAFT_47029 [Epithele typhae]|uniref:uncharacterized protein n=1 Tax=Epithele typhae TaxID=378194 RepID=UPI0020076AD8|nr:uncharacterized protein BXZ73DRAFT_47029 [Epithele typhae]KAH9932120.1 hypothetical protein BXZ73DRAFT_47029 [Epithele typhae]